MMLHRHFEGEKPKNVTTLKDVTPGADPEKAEKPAEEETLKRTRKTKKS